MSIGPNYVEKWIWNKDVGEYLEYHDRPHLHVPMNEDASGYLILGKLVGKECYCLTAFSIPYGYGIYTPPNIIHSDAHLVGKYLTVYSKTESYSTVILKNKDGDNVNIII
jgi:hypothetical protein